MPLAVVLSLAGQSGETPAPAEERVGPGPVALPGRETLSYGVEWRLIRAGRATLGWAPAPEPAAGEGRAHWQTSVVLESTGLVSRLYKVDDQYTSQLGEDLCALSSFMKAHEGGRRRETTVTYDGAEGKARYLERDLVKNNIVKQDEIDIPGCVHDVVGGLFLLRTMQVEPGKTINIPVSDGKKSVSARVEAQARETVKTPLGTYKTIRYEVFLFNNVLYRRSGHLYVWLTDDDRRVPVQIRARMKFHIGTITFQLEKEERE